MSTAAASADSSSAALLHHSRRLRTLSLARLLRQEPGYFDDEANAAGPYGGEASNVRTAVRLLSVCSDQRATDLLARRAD